jgi:sugar-specific transcriptional regulator TrmB
MSTEVAGLVDLGLTSLQASVYLALLRLGTSKASRIAAVTGIVRPEVYRVIRELSAKALVERNPSSPSTYSAATPSQALSVLFDRFSMRLETLERKRTALLKSLMAYVPPSESTLEERFSMITGGGNLIIKSRQLLTDAKQDYVGIISKWGLRRSKDTGYAKALVRAKKRKVRVRLISETDENNAHIADFISRRVELRRSREISFYIEIADRKQMILGPAVVDEEATERNEREVDLWTNNPRFIHGMYAFFERLWRMSPRYS